jgi:hypothetical protein
MSNDTTLKEEVRVITGYDTITLSSDELDTVLKRAKRHIRTRKDLEQSFDFYAEASREEALFWWTCLFAKVSAGELDSQSINVAAVDVDTLLAKDDDEITQWYRSAMLAMRSMTPAGEDYPGETGITSPQRDGREYGRNDKQETAFDI